VWPYSLITVRPTLKFHWKVATSKLVRFAMFGFELSLAFFGEYENYTFLESL